MLTFMSTLWPIVFMRATCPKIISLNALLSVLCLNCLVHRVAHSAWSQFSFRSRVFRMRCVIYIGGTRSNTVIIMHVQHTRSYVSCSCRLRPTPPKRIHIDWTWERKNQFYFVRRAVRIQIVCRVKTIQCLRLPPLWLQKKEEEYRSEN